MVIELLSTSRLSRYGLGQDEQSLVLARYKWNLALSEALYPSLSLLEVALRNQVDLAISELFSPQWLNEDWSGWIRTPIMKRKALPNPEKESVMKAKQSLVRDAGDWTRGKLVAELNFGFWVGMFKSYYHTGLWNQKNKPLRKVFPQSKGLSPKEIYLILNNIRRFRNRIAHHEPIFDNPHLMKDYETVFSVIGWLGTDLKTMALELDRFPDVLKRGVTL